MDRLVILLALACLAIAYAAKPGHIITPFGYVREECYHEIPSGSVISENKDTGVVTIKHEYSQVFMQIPPCNTGKAAVQVQKRAVEEYNGWLAYTTFHYPDGIDSFLGDFSVPEAPAKEPEVLYIFTGLQNVDWIPKVDPEPAVFDIIQPVLQYPGSKSGEWGVKSWYVTLSGDVYATSMIPAAIGSNIFGNMTRVGPDKWYIGSTNSAGKTTEFTIARDRLKIQPWAYNTLECYGCEDCSYEPTTVTKFTKLQLFSAGKQVTPTWVTHKSPNPKCHELAVVNGPESVDIYFNKN